MKLLQPIDVLVASGLTYIATMPELFIRFVGPMEILDAIRLILPTLTRILPKLMPAAVGLSIVQVGALILHASRAEFVVLPINVALLVLALFVVWGRSRKAPIASR